MEILYIIYMHIILCRKTIEFCCHRYINNMTSISAMDFVKRLNSFLITRTAIPAEGHIIIFYIVSE